MSSEPKPTLPFGEFVALMAMMMSLAALSTDAMLPALSTIGAELGVLRPNDNQLIVSILFLGIAAGQIFYGPISDSTGRKPAIYAGFAIFMTGSLLSMVAPTFSIMLSGRFLQGLGAAGSRSVTLALIRDQYEGRSMAQVMSFVTVVFILVPVIAPSVGQAVLLFAQWRAIFGLFLLLALITVTWFGLRQPETIGPEKRSPFSLQRILKVLGEILRNRAALGYTLIAGLVSGAFLGYLNSAQQLFQVQYELGVRFPLFFAALALSIGCASFLNGRLVMRYGMRLLSRWALLTVVTLAIVYFVAAASLWAGIPPLWSLMIFFLATLFCVGILFGNLNALAMEPLGRVAGVGSAVVGSLSTFVSVPLGILVGQSYNGTVLPLVGGFALFSIVGVAIMIWANR